MAGPWQAVAGQTGESARSSTAETTRMTPPELPSVPVASKPVPRRFDLTWLWFPGAIAFYLALQLWILPKLGVPT